MGARLIPRRTLRLRLHSLVALATAVAVFASAALTFLLGAPASAANGDITTIAGNGSTTPAIVDGAVATSGALNQPDGVVYDAAQNLVIVEYGAGRVRQVAPDGTTSTLAAAGTFTNPTDVVVSPTGDLVIADYGGHKVRKISGGTVSTVAGSGLSGFGGDGGPATTAKLDYPAAVAYDAASNLYIADSGNNRVRRVAAKDGKISTFAGTGTAGFSGDGGNATSAQLNQPTGLALDSAGNLYIADSGNNRVRKVGTTGKISTVAGTGTAGHTGDGGAATAAQLSFPVGLTFDSAGALFVAEYGSDVVRRVSATGTISTVAGTGVAGYSGDGGAATSAQLHDPIRVALDAAGNLVIGDRANNRVRRLELNTPAAPVITGFAPPSPSPQTSITVTGTAPAGVTVSVYANGTCAGGPVATGSAATFASPGISVTVGANATTTLSASDQGTGNRSGCSPAVTYTSDNVAPAAPAITSSPPSSGTGQSARWTFTAEPAATTTCWLTDGSGATVDAPASCNGAATYTVTVGDTYTFHVKARDAAGNVGPEATSAYTLVTVGPVIVGAPATPGVARSVAWTFTSVDPAPTCELTRGGTVVSASASCTSGVAVSYDLTGQPDDTFTFTVVESGGGQVASTSTYVLDTAAPTISAAPPAVGAGRSPAWSFSGGTGTRTVCSLSGPAPTTTMDPCTSPATFDLTGAPDGSYTFTVWSADGADVGQTATSGYALLTTTPPQASITAPPTPSNDPRPTWQFSGPSGTTATCGLAEGARVVQAPTSCSGLETYDLSVAGEPDGTYTFTVVLTNAAGTSGPPATSDYVVDRVAPAAPAITAAPTSPDNFTGATWTFTAEPGATTSCSLTNGATTVAPRAACPSPVTYDLSGQPDGDYVFSVDATDPAGNVSPATTSTYTLDTTLPNQATFTAVPVSPGNSVHPTWAFSSPADATASCTLQSGSSVIAGPATCAGSYTADLTGHPDGVYTLSVTTVDAANNASAPASSSYTIDTAAPAAPTITSAPASPSNALSASWSFTAEPGATASCALTSGASVIASSAPCTSPVPYDLSGQADGDYVFSVNATDAAGNTGADSTSTYTLDTAMPNQATFTASPASPGNDVRPTWAFSSPADATASCTLQSGATVIAGPAACSGSYTADLTGHPDGVYTLSVTTTDAAGNASGPASSSYALDTAAPAAPTVTSAPASPSNSRSVAWTFTAEPGATTSCSLTNGATTVAPRTTCPSPATYDLSGQPDGDYVFSVDATDPAGNVSSATTSTYTLDTVAPGAPSITAAPVSPSPNRSVSWSFTAEPGTTASCALTTGGTTIATRSACSSPVTYDLSGQSDGDYTFSVDATDAAGNRSAVSSSSYELDTTAPAAPSFTQLPLDTGSARTVSWSFSAPAGSALSCTLSSQAGVVDGPKACTTGYTADLSNRPDGPYTLSVVAIDAAGNASAPVESVYTLDATPPSAPVVVANAGPTGTVQNPSWTFDLEPGSTATCSLQRGEEVVSAAAPCTSPVTYDLAGQPAGLYTLTIVATDSAGNVGPPTVLGYNLVLAVVATPPPAAEPPTTEPPAPEPPTTQPPAPEATPAPAPADVPVVTTTTTTAPPAPVPRPRPVTPVTLPPARPPAEEQPSVAAQIARVAKVVGEKTAFPSGLGVLVVVFLAMQDRIDRGDPKLALAPVHADPDLGFDPPHRPGDQE